MLCLSKKNLYAVAYFLIVHVGLLDRLCDQFTLSHLRLGGLDAM